MESPLEEEAQAEAQAAVEPQEFASVSIMIDHLLMNDPQEKTVVKTVWSTETAHESLLAQSAYFANRAASLNLADPDTFRLIGQGLDEDVAYIYVVDERQTNIIVDVALWSEAIANPALGNGTVLGTVTSFIVMATEMVKLAREAGRISRLFVFAPRRAAPERAVA